MQFLRARLLTDKELVPSLQQVLFGTHRLFGLPQGTEQNQRVLQSVSGGKSAVKCARLSVTVSRGREIHINTTNSQSIKVVRVPKRLRAAPFDGSARKANATAH